MTRHPVPVPRSLPVSVSSRRTRSAASIAMAALLASLLAALAGCSTEGPGDTAATTDTLFTDSPAAWFEAYFASLDVAPDGSRAAFDGQRLIALDDGREVPLAGGLETVFFVTFDAEGTPVLRGRPAGGETGWFRIGDPEGPAEPLPSIPATGRPHWSPSGARVAYEAPPVDGGPRLGVAPADGSGEPASHPLPGAPSAISWASESAVLVLVPDERGLGTLYEVDAATGDTRTAAADLDGPWQGSTIGVSADGRTAYLALASDGSPDPEARHRPDADRDLDIWEVDLATGTRRPVVRTPAEEVAPVVAGNALHWVSILTRSEVVIVPVDGGEARVVAEGVQTPTWRPDGRAIGVTTGDWRLADWALNLDGGVIEIDADGRPTGPVAPIITGYHEDFGPTWSPDGRWIAYHSHRSATPVAGYAAEGSTDDIFLRRPEAPMSEEIRLTDFGWEVGTPDWAPDGRRLLLDSWDRERPAGGRGARSWIVELDPDTGAFIGRAEVPAPADAAGIPTWGAWSPTRDELAITFAVPRATRGELWVMAPDGSSPRRIVAFEGARYGGVDWTADGEALVYSALADGRQQLFRVPRAGGDPVKLTDDAASLFHPQVSPDGRWIAASRIRHTKRILRRPLP